MPTEYDDLDNLIASREKKEFGKAEKWKKKEPPILDVWLAGRLVSFYRHGMPELVSWTKDDVTTEKVFSRDWNCHESDAVLANQNKRDKHTGVREVPPEVCPQCKAVEWVRACIFRGAWGASEKDTEARVARSAFEPLFVMRGADDDGPTIIRAAAFCGLIGDKTPQSWKVMARKLNEELKAGINLSEAWKENGKAKQVFLFRIVDNDDLDAGVQKIVEASSLGDAVVKVIADRRESLGREKGDVYKHPYCIRLKYKPKEQQFNKKYDALRLEEVQINDAVRALLAQPPLDYSKDVAPFNAKLALAKMQQHCQIKNVPWGELFEAAIARQEGEKPPTSGATHSVPASPPPTQAAPASPPPTQAAPPAQRRTRADAADPKAAMLALKRKFDALDPNDPSLIECGAVGKDGKPCPQLMPPDYSGDCPACGPNGVGLLPSAHPVDPMKKSDDPGDQLPF